MRRELIVVLFASVLDLPAQPPPQQFLLADAASRQAALRQLATLSPQQKSAYISELVPLLRDNEAHRVLLAFVKIGPLAVPALSSRLIDPNRGVRGFAAEALAMIRPVASETVKKLRLMPEDELAEAQRKRENEQRALAERTRAHTQVEVLAPIPPDPEHRFALEVSQRFESKAPDGTTLLTVLHKGEQRDDLLRVWKSRLAPDRSKARMGSSATS